jgi:hypothetical protein
MCIAHLRPIVAALLTVVVVSLFMAAAVAAQLTPQEKQRVIATLTSEINRAIQKYPSVPEIRDKVVRRVSECAFLFKTLEGASPEPEFKKSLADASDVSREVMVLLAAAMPLDRYKAIVNGAHDSIIQMSKRQDRKELSLLLRNCKSFNELHEIDQAVQELTL